MGAPPDEDEPGASFWHELKRRKVFRVATAYAIACFVILQILDATGEALGMTATAVQILLAAMVAGFPITLALAWFLEITPEGLIADPSGRLARRFGRGLEVAVLTALFMAAGLLASWIILNAIRTAASGELRIAVLAFENFTGDPTNSYISDGLAEELIDGLTSIDDLVVLPRTATFYYKDKDVDFETIAERLKVDMLLEGSLLDRRNDRMRVTAQLIDVRESRHLWSHIYDHRLGDLIQVKQDITRNVVDALALALAPEAEAALETPPTSSSEAYDLYLQGKDYLQRAATREEREAARDLFASAFRVDPSFAQALAGQCRAEIGLYALSTRQQDYRAAQATCTRVAALADGSPESRLALAELGRTAGNCEQMVGVYREVIEQAPELEPAYYGLARCEETLGRPDAADALYQRSIDLERRNWQVYLGYSGFLYRQGRYLESAVQCQRIVELTPDNGLAWSNLGTALFAADRWAQAEQAWRRGHELAPNQYSYVNIATALYYQHRFQDAADLLEQATEAYPDNYRVWGKLGAAYRNLPGAEARMRDAYQTAIELAEQAVEVNPDAVSVLGPLGVYHANVGNFGAADSTLARAVELAPADPELRFFQALVRRLRNDEAAARDYLEQARKLGYSRKLMAQEPLTEALASGS